ncbi:MAG: hypothetical protein KIT55_00925 [Nitrosomonas sp.]|nr:hypothetical protein [Nitrosomonas sp.]
MSTIRYRGYRYDMDVMTGVKCRRCQHLRPDNTCTHAVGGYDAQRRPLPMDIDKIRNCRWYDARRKQYIPQHSEESSKMAEVISTENGLKEVTAYLTKTGIPECDHQYIINPLRHDPEALRRYVNTARRSAGKEELSPKAMIL